MESSVWCLSATPLGEDLRWQNSKQQFWSTHLSKRWKRAKVGQKRSLRQGSILLFIYYILYITLKVQVLLHRAQLVHHLLGGHHPHLPPLQIRFASGAPPPSQVHHHLVRFPNPLGDGGQAGTLYYHHPTTQFTKHHLQSEYNKIMVNFALSLLLGFLPLVILQVRDRSRHCQIGWICGKVTIGPPFNPPPQHTHTPRKIYCNLFSENIRKSPLWRSKICNIDFWIENSPPPPSPVRYGPF